MTNIITKTDLWGWNKIKLYNEFDLQKFVDSERPILSLQKSVVKGSLAEILEWMWIENLDTKTLEKNMWRAGFFSIDSKEYWELGFLATKWADSTKSFAQISDYYLWGTDIWDKVQARWLKLEKIQEILWEILWWYKTELLLLLWIKFLEWDFSKKELDILTTKFTPTLTKKVIEQLPENMIIPTIDTVDSNSELNIQIQEILNPWKNVWAVEIVQSWNSLISTNSFPVQNGIIYEPSKRDKETWTFTWEVIGKLDPESQVWKIANWIQSEINLALYDIISDKNNNPKEFIDAIQNSMRNFKK